MELICSSRNQFTSDYQFSTRAFQNDTLVDDDMDYSYSYRSDGGLLLNPYNTTGTLRNARTIGNYRSFEINDDGVCFVIFAESIK